MSAHQDPLKLKSWLEKYWFSEKIQVKVLSDNPGFDYDLFDSIDDNKRILNCIPKAPNEINEANNPFELGLEKLISWDKGCYIGQEVISRLDTYDKVSRKLVALCCDENDFENLKSSSEVTSSVNQFKKDQSVALALVKKAALTVGGFLTTSNGTKTWVVSSAR